MAAMYTRCIRIQIEERKTDWVLYWRPSPEAAEYHATAAEALAAVQEMARILAAGGINTFFTINWISHTRVGTLVVRALQ